MFQAILGKSRSNERALEIDRAAKCVAVEKSQAVIEFTPDGNILTANDKFLGALGYRLEEIEGRHHSMFVEAAEKDSSAYRQFWNSLRAGQYQQAEYKRIGKGGKEVWIQASYNPVADERGQIYKVVKFATDVTAAKMASIENAGILDAIRRTQAVISFKMDGTIIEANDLFLNAMGYSAAEIVGKHHSMFVGRDYAASQDYREFWRMLNTGRALTGTYQRLGRNNKEVWIQGSYNPILDPNGKPIRVVKFATDITASVSMALSIEHVVNTVSAAATELHASADSVKAAASSGNAKANTVAAASEELNASIGEIARQVTGAQQASDEADANSARAKAVVDDLAKAASSIGEVVKFIENIAEETNLLALNATIEAARAGEAGRGFAVVASEVKALATQTSKATGDIGAQIRNMQNAASAAVEANVMVASAIKRINEVSSAIAGAMEEQSAATQNVAVNISDVSHATQEVDRIAVDVNSASSELAQNSERLLTDIRKYLKTLGVERR